MKPGNTKKKKMTSQESGIAGMYYVASELTRRGCIALITTRNTRGIDILASSKDGTRQAAIQVKTRQGKSNSWTMSKSDETNTSKTLFYVFVNILEDGVSGDVRLQYHVLPSKVVAAQVKAYSREYLAKIGMTEEEFEEDRKMKGKNTKMRNFSPAERYKNAWDSLGLW